MKTRTDLTGAELKTLEACQTATDWSRACDAIKLAHGGGYPTDWYAKVIQSGMANRIAARWGSDAELHFTVIPTENEEAR